MFFLLDFSSLNQIMIISPWFFELPKCTWTLSKKANLSSILVWASYMLKR